jgi:hypothetical protein
MKSPRFHTPFRTTRLLVLGGLALPIHLTAQVVDPDPELFDGSRTATEQQEEQKQTTVDDWEGANLVVYDSDEQGNSRGGMGRTGNDAPGMDIGVRGPGMGGGMPIPLPVSGGGMGIGGSGLEIPEMAGQQGGAGEEGEQQQSDAAGGGGNPQGNQQGPQGKGGKGGGREPPQKPGEVAIGDDSKRIQSAAAPVGDTEGLEKSAEDSKGDGGDDTQMKAASGAQTGTRGGGVEKGDAIPTDL